MACNIRWGSVPCTTTTMHRRTDRSRSQPNRRTRFRDVPPVKLLREGFFVSRRSLTQRQARLLTADMHTIINVCTFFRLDTPMTSPCNVCHNLDRSAKKTFVGDLREAEAMAQAARVIGGMVAASSIVHTLLGKMMPTSGAIWSM